MPLAYGFKEFGGPEQQTMLEVPLPVLQPGELLVKVHAAAINPLDVKFRKGLLRAKLPTELPGVMGREAAGVIVDKAPGVEEFQLGQPVFGLVRGGAYAEFTRMSVEEAVPMPDGLSFVDAATLAVAGATAYDGVAELGLKRGETLLINGAGGGVGIFAAQLAQTSGVEVIGIASAEKAEFLQKYGMTAVAYGPEAVTRVRAIASSGVDGLYDVVGGSSFRELAACVKDPTKVLTTFDDAVAAEVGGRRVDRTYSREVLLRLAELVVTHRLNPPVTDVIPFERAADGLKIMESGHALGKIVITFGEGD
jgi:NADPH:quinone reductase-like Zn-dependent oxidoreductase